MAAAAFDTATFRFSNDDELALWREVAGRIALPLDLAMLHPEASTWSLLGVQIWRMVKFDGLTAGMRCIVVNRNEDVTLNIVGNAGVSNAMHLSHETFLREGEVVPAQSAGRGPIARPSLTRAMAVQVSRKLLAEMVPDLDDRLARPITILRDDNEPLRLLIHYVDALIVGPALMTPNLRRLAAVHIRDLVAEALSATGNATAPGEDGIRAARLHAIKADIRERLGDPNLSLAEVAARQGVSARYVQSLFESEGKTFSAFVLAQRLARAHRRLADPQCAHRPIGAIAVETGFGNRSHFNRAFRQRYGAAPSAVRAMALRKVG